mmetsp:Transcript_7972/g.13371  ORF Transcript_7972/g.13371 Transcript_7972/m.13371 type:complete len:316 (-) Transcript_7972:96-1043(-)
MSLRRTAPRLLSSWMNEVPLGPPDALFGLIDAYNKDPAPQKVGLGIGAYRDDAGKPFVLPSIRKAEEMLLAASLNHEYAGIDGVPEFLQHSLKFAYGSKEMGSESEALESGRVGGVQTISGTGALRIGGEFLARFRGKGTPFYLPNPTWANHIPIFKDAGLDVRSYSYYDADTRGLNFKGMLDDCHAAPTGSAFLLHACAHNPTGCDPTRAQWKELSNLLKGKKHHVFFDSAYQGFASGDAAADAWALREFVSDYEEQLQTSEEGGRFGSLLLAQSFAKNFGLYGERVGTLSVVCPTAQVAGTVLSQLKLIIRPM